MVTDKLGGPSSEVSRHGKWIAHALIDTDSKNKSELYLSPHPELWDPHLVLQICVMYKAHAIG